MAHVVTKAEDPKLLSIVKLAGKLTLMIVNVFNKLANFGY